MKTSYNRLSGERVELKRHGRPNAATAPVDRCDRGISDTGVGARRAWAGELPPSDRLRQVMREVLGMDPRAE